MPFRVTLPEGTWLTEELTVDEACAIEDELGVSWLDIQPIGKATHARAIARAFLSRFCSADEAAKRAGALTLHELTESVVRFSDDDGLPNMFENGVPDPKAVEPPSTPT